MEKLVLYKVTPNGILKLKCKTKEQYDNALAQDREYFYTIEDALIGMVSLLAERIEKLEKKQITTC